VRQEGGTDGETEGNTEGETAQTFLNVSVDVNKGLKFHMTQALSVKSNTNYCIINTFAFSQSGVSTCRFYFTPHTPCSLLNTTVNV